MRMQDGRSEDPLYKLAAGGLRACACRRLVDELTEAAESDSGECSWRERGNVRPCVAVMQARLKGNSSRAQLRNVVQDSGTRFAVETNSSLDAGRKELQPIAVVDV